MSEIEVKKHTSIWDVIRKVLTVLLVLVCVFIMLCTCLISVLNDNDNDFIFGYKPYINDDSLVLVTKPNNIEIGDSVVYRSIEPNHYNEVCFDVIEEDTVYEEEIAYVTVNMDDDGMYYPVKYSKIIGINNVVIPRFGSLINFLSKPVGYILLVILPFLLGVSIRVIDIIKK
mgnify:CR=1 FL=1